MPRPVLFKGRTRSKGDPITWGTKSLFVARQEMLAAKC